MLETQPFQNRRQKVFRRGALRLCGGASHSKNWHKLHCFLVFHFSIWGLELCLGWLGPPKPPRGDGTEPFSVKSLPTSRRISYTMKTTASWYKRRSFFKQQFATFIRGVVGGAATWCGELTLPALSASETKTFRPGVHKFSLLPPALCLFLWITATTESKIFLFFCIASVLLPHTDPSLVPHVSVWLSFCKVSSCSRQMSFYQCTTAIT